MSMQITIEVPETLGQQVHRFQGRLTEALERGLRDLTEEEQADYRDESGIMELLASQPTPQQVLALRPTPELQERVSDLLYRSKQGELSREEEAELDKFLMLEHIVRLAKAHAYRHAARQP